MAINDKVARPLTATLAAGDSVVGPFRAVENDPIMFTRTGGGTGRTQLLRSIDGGVTKLPLTAGGEAWGVFTADCNEPVWEESEVGASFYVQATGITGTVKIRVTQ